MPELFHTTDAAEAILRGGFRASTGSYGLAGGTFDGVFLSAGPAGVSDGAKGEQVLRVTFPEGFDLDPFAIRENGQRVWEWCVPAAKVNAAASVTLLSAAEVDELVR